MGIRTIDISISLTGAGTTAGRATVLDRSPPDRLLRAGLALAALWAIAAFCIVIPVAHFVLVPAFGMAGVVLAGFRLREGSSLIGAVGVCPRCAVERTFPPSGRYHEGGTIHCDGCGSLLEVKASTAAS
jgi:hypothetical protein